VGNTILTSATPRKPLASLASRAHLVLLLGFYCTAISFAADIRSIEVEKSGERYLLVSRTHFDAPQKDVYNTLLDYDQLASISSAIKESHYLDPDKDGKPLIYTRISACVLFYCKTVEKVEQLEVDMPDFIATTAIPERSTVRYSRSEWSLAEKEGGGTDVTYNLEFEPTFWVPPIIGPIIIKRMLLKEGASAVQKIEAMAQRRAAERDITTAY